MAMNAPTISSNYQRRDFGNPIVQVVLLLIILVLFSWFILKPKYAQYNQRKADLSTAQSQLKKIQNEQLDLDKLVKQLHSSADDVALLDEAVPLNGRISKVYVLLSGLVQNSGLSLGIISADETQSIISAGDKTTLADPYKGSRTLHTIIVSAQVNGSMEQFKNLLQLIETNGRLLDVDSVEVIGSDTQPKFRIKVKAYAYEDVIKP